MKIKVTIGVCLRNCEKDVKQIVDRILYQDFPHDNMEVFFVDDGSEDETLSSIRKYASKMDIKYTVYHHEWKGLGFSRNVVSKNAQGDYIVWVDDGTILPKDYVRKNIEFMEKHLNVGIVRGVMGIYFGPNLIPTLENMPALVFRHKYMGKMTTKLPGIAGAFFRVKAMRQVGGFDERIKGAMEDTDIAHRIKSAGWQIFITNTEFHTELNEKLKKVWDKNFWYGYGLHFVLHKNKELSELLYKSTPFIGFLEGVLISFKVYKLTSRKVSFLLPIYFSIKRLAWCLGFIKSHMDSCGHIQETASSSLLNN